MTNTLYLRIIGPILHVPQSTSFTHTHTHRRICHKHKENTGKADLGLKHKHILNRIQRKGSYTSIKEELKKVENLLNRKQTRH